MMFDFLLVFNLVVVVLYSLLFGSFLGVVIDRSISGDQFFKGRSVCDHCKHLLNPIDLIPLFSFLKTKGNCRYCGAKISKWLLVYELGTLVFNLLIYFFCDLLAYAWWYRIYFCLCFCKCFVGDIFI